MARAAPLGLLLVVGVWLVLGLPGLGDYGLWDPWEMDQAAVARRMIGPTRVLAVEHASASQPGPAAAWLSARYADALYVGTLDTSSAAAAARDVDLRNRAQKRLDAEIFHVLVLDGKAFFTDPASHADVRTLVEWLDPVIGRNPGMEVLLLVPPGTSASTLRSTYADVRVDLAGRELLGSSFPRSDTFRRDLQKWLKPAKEGTWAPFAHLVPAAADDGFLVKAFWRAARARRLDEALASPLPEALSAQLAEAPLFQLPAAVLEWPAAADYQALLKDFQTGGAEAPQSARAAATAVEGAIDRTLGRPAWRAQFKARGQTWSVPPLDYWLMAASFRRLGFSELASRLPAFCLGLVGLVGLFWVALRLFGPGAATLSGLVLCTCPIFFAQARSVAGGVSFATALVLIIGSTAVMIQAGRIRAGALVVLAVGSVMAFLAEGLFGLLVPTTCLVAYVLAARDLRPAALVPAGLLAAALGALWLVVARSGDWSFWSHFDLRAALWSWDPSPAARAHNLNFDVLIRQIGFGAAPWSVLIPFGIGLFAMDFARDRSRTAILIVLWFLVPFAVGGALLKHGNHLVYQAIPAGCLAVGVLLHRAWRGHGLSAVAGLTAAIILGILIREVGKSPEPLTSFLTVDPPFNVKKSGTPYPDGMHLPGALKAALGLVALLFLWHAARLASRARRIAVGLARPRVFWWGFSALATLLVALLLSRVESQIALSFNGPTGALLEGVHRVFVRDVFYWRPESWLVIAGGAGALLLAGYRPVLSAVGRWLRAWVLVPFAGWSLAVGLAGGALVAAAAGSEDGLFAAADHLLALVVLTLVPIAGRFALGRRAAPPGVPRGVRAHGLAGLRLLLGTGGPAAAVCLGLCWALLHVAAGLAAEPEAVPPALALALAGTFFLGLTDVLAEPRAGLRAAGMATAGALIWALAVRAAAGPVGLGALGLPLGIGVTATLVELDVLARLGRGITASMRWLGQTPAVATGAAGLALVGTLALGGTGSAGATAANPAVWVGVGITALAWWLGRRRMLGVTPYGAFDATTPVLLLAASVAFVGGTITGRITGFPGRLPQDLAADRISAGVLAAMLAIAALLAVVRFVMVRPRPLARTFHLGTGALLLALAALGLVLRFGSPDPNRIGWATWQSPAFWLSSGALLCLAALAALAWLDRGERWLPPRSLFHGLRRLRNPALLYGLALFIGFVGITAMTVQLLKETPLTLAHFAALGPAQTIDAAMIRSQGLLIALLIALPGLLWLGLLAPWIRARPARGVAVALPLGLILSAQMLWPLVRKWQQLESAVQGLDAEPFLPYLFWGSRVTRLLYIAVAALALVFVAGRVPAILRRLRDPRALVEAAAISVFALLLWVALPPIAGLIRGVDSATLWSGAAGSASLRAKAAALVAVLLVGLVGLDRRMRGGTAVRLLRVGELVKRPRVFIVLLAAAFSFHVSQ